MSQPRRRNSTVSPAPVISRTGAYRWPYCQLNAGMFTKFVPSIHASVQHGSGPVSPRLRTTGELFGGFTAQSGAFFGGSRF
jgi:hypothetical protein